MPGTEPRPAQAALVSVVVTVRNEERHLGALLESLLLQQGPFEVLVVDSDSEDRTRAIAQDYAAKHPEIQLLLHGGTRGESRNFGVAQAKGEAVAFIDGDCVADPGWLHALRARLGEHAIVAGATRQVGKTAWQALERVELKHKGFEVTAPSCNLAYRRAVFEELGGFDPWFRTAEDIDLNFRAVDRGHSIAVAGDALVFHKSRDTFVRFLKQAVWNGYGRKQLTLKHGKLWSAYSLRRMFQTQITVWGVLRLGAALAGYMVAKVREGHQPRQPRAEEREGRLHVPAAPSAARRP
ncbi:MAG TPA: glycosyltransferase [Candidatus Thermoplasmatota archaeon]|jgi:glycosyltransferase involved in cell wall biosynthesis|nr:glycosyltransferase [Candidatus Thermoplasmatota archaeon]